MEVRDSIVNRNVPRVLVVLKNHLRKRSKNVLPIVELQICELNFTPKVLRRFVPDSDPKERGKNTKAWPLRRKKESLRRTLHLTGKLVFAAQARGERYIQAVLFHLAAHARLMFRHEVLRTDAVVAVVTVESSMTTSAILENMTNALHSSFKDEPDAEYREIESQILTALAIPIPSEEERASERTRGRQGEAPRGDHEDALCGVQNVGEERCGEQETRLDEGRSEKNSGAEEMGLPHKRASDVLEPLGSPVGESDRHPDGRTEAEVGGISDKDALSDIGFAREEGTLRDEPGTDDAARWQAEARALDERLKGFRRAGVDVSATGEAAWAPESAAPSLRSLERGIQERVASSGNVAQEDRLLKSSRRCEHSKQEGDLLGTRLRAPGGDQGGLERAAEGPVESTDHLGACEGAGSRGPGIATGKERRRAEALKMLEDFDEELLQEFDFSGGSDSPVGTELPVCLSPLARKSSGSQSPLSSGHVASGGGANVVAGGRTRGSTGPSSADVASRKGGHVARGGSTGNCQSESVGKVEAQEGTRIDSGQYAVTSDGANARSDKHLDSPNWTAQQEGDGASRIPEDGSSSLPHDCAPGARPSSAAHQGSAQETSDLIRTLTQRLARPPRIVQTELPNDLGSSAPEERQPQDTPRVSRLDGYETQLRVAPLADRAVNEINRIPDQAAGLGIIRKRLLERRSADESEDPNWVSDEQWGLRSPKKRARDC